MNISENKILSMLGINVAEGGIEINPNDFLLLSNTLSLIRSSINLDDIDLKQLKIINAGASLMTGVENNNKELTKEQIQKSKAFIEVFLKKKLGFSMRTNTGE